MASSTKSCGTGADDSSVGTKAWSSVTAIYTSNNSYASVNVNTFEQFSHYLKCTNFGFAIPSGATIDGIIAEFEGFYSDSSPDDNRVRIVKGGTIGSTDRSSASAWPSSDSYRSYGSSSDLWGETWADTDINSSGFGVALAIKKISGNSYLLIDHVRITVYYTEGGGGGGSQSPVSVVASRIVPVGMGVLRC